MRRVICFVACMVLLALPVSAADGDLEERQREQLGVDRLEDEAQGFLSGTDISLDGDLEENLKRLLDTGTAQLHGVLRKALRSGALMLIVVLLCGMGQSLPVATKNMVVPLTGTLAIAAITVGDVNSLLGMGREAIGDISDFANVLLPVVAAVTAATGAITGAAARQMAAMLFSGLLTNLISRLLIPLVYGYVAAQVAWGAVGNDGLKRVAKFLKWLTVTVLSVVLLAFVGYLTLSGVVAGAADSAAIKATKFAISGAVPVVGGIISDAAETVLASAGILRGTVGVFGMLVVLAICLTPFLHLSIHYLIYKAVAAVSSTMGEGRICGLLDGIGGAFGILLGMTGACALLLLITLVSSVMVVTI